MKNIDVSTPYKMRKSSYYDLTAVKPSLSYLTAVAKYYSQLFKQINGSQEDLVKTINNDKLISFYYHNNFYLWTNFNKNFDINKYQAVTELLSVGQLTLSYLQSHKWRFNVNKLTRLYSIQSKTINMDLNILSKVDDNRDKQKALKQYEDKIGQDIDLTDNLVGWRSAFINLLKNIHIQDKKTAQKGIDGRKFANFFLPFDENSTGGSMSDVASDYAGMALASYKVIEVNNAYVNTIRQSIKGNALEPERENARLSQLIKQLQK